MRRPVVGAQSAQYAAAFPALSEVYNHRRPSLSQKEGANSSCRNGSSSRSSSGTKGVPRQTPAQSSARGETRRTPQSRAAPVASCSPSTARYLASSVSNATKPNSAEDTDNTVGLSGACAGEVENGSDFESTSAGELSKGDGSHHVAMRSRSTPRHKAAFSGQESQEEPSRRDSPRRPPAGQPRRPVNATVSRPDPPSRARVHEAQEWAPSKAAAYENALTGSALPRPPVPPPPAAEDSQGRGGSETFSTLRQQQQLRSQQRQHHNAFAAAATLRKAAPGAHYLHQVEAPRGPSAFGSALRKGALRAEGSGRGAAGSPVEASRRLVYPLNCLCLQPLGDGRFRAVPRAPQREGHRQRVAGVDVWRLPDGCIVPRIEGLPLQSYLAERKDALEELKAALLGCVMFLYNEGIKPFAGEIAHQMRKRTNAGTWLPSEVVALAMASRDVYPRVERRVKGEDGWVILLRDKLVPKTFEGFVDTRAKENLYSQEQWLQFNRYFIDKLRQGSVSASSFTEGRYALAERLREEVPAFRTTPLAHLIRMIQLASWNRVLTYRDKALIPVAACPTAAKEFIQRHLVDPTGEKAAAHAASLTHLLRVMRRIVNPEPAGIFLAQLKDLVRWTTHERLDSGQLGHAKLQDLLLAEPFTRYYRLYTPEGNEHCTYVQSRQYVLPKGAVPHKKASVSWEPGECPMDAIDEHATLTYGDARVWNYKALVPVGHCSADARDSAAAQHQQLQQEQKPYSFDMRSWLQPGYQQVLEASEALHKQRPSPPDVSTVAPQSRNPSEQRFRSHSTKCWFQQQESHSERIEEGSRLCTCRDRLWDGSCVCLTRESSVANPDTCGVLCRTTTRCTTAFCSITFSDGTRNIPGEQKSGQPLFCADAGDSRRPSELVRCGFAEYQQTQQQQPVHRGEPTRCMSNSPSDGKDDALASIERSLLTLVDESSEADPCDFDRAAGAGLLAAANGGSTLASDRPLFPGAGCAGYSHYNREDGLAFFPAKAHRKDRRDALDAEMPTAADTPRSDALLHAQPSGWLTAADCDGGGGHSLPHSLRQHPLRRLAPEGWAAGPPTVDAKFPASQKQLWQEGCGKSSNQRWSCGASETDDPAIPGLQFLTPGIPLLYEPLTHGRAQVVHIQHFGCGGAD